MLSKRIVEFIAANDLGHANIQRIAHKSPGLYAINTAPDGERSFTYWRGDSAARQMFSDADFRVLEQFDGLYLSGITLGNFTAKHSAGSSGVAACRAGSSDF